MFRGNKYILSLDIKGSCAWGRWRALQPPSDICWGYCTSKAKVLYSGIGRKPLPRGNHRASLKKVRSKDYANLSHSISPITVLQQLCFALPLHNMQASAFGRPSEFHCFFTRCLFLSLSVVEKSLFPCDLSSPRRRIFQQHGTP